MMHNVSIAIIFKVQLLNNILRKLVSMKRSLESIENNGRPGKMGQRV